MPTTIQASPFDFGLLLIFLRAAILIILAFYAIFALIIVRQVDLMGKALMTGVSPVVRAIAILHAGFAIGFIALVFGIL